MAENEQPPQQQPPPHPKSEVLKRTVFVEGLRISVEKLAQRIKPLYAEKYGDKAVTCLVRRRDGYEITFATEGAAHECAETGLEIEHRKYDVVNCAEQELLLTMYTVPAYVEDEAIIAKLAELNCEVIGGVKRAEVHGIETGRRKVVVKLPHTMRSLPKIISVKAAHGKDEKIELYHRNQRMRKSTR